MAFKGEIAAAAIFLVGYVAIFCWMLFAYLTHRIKWKSRYSLLFFHVTIRVASQSCGVAFGVLGFRNTDVFLAYLILGAEGYFSLVLCAFRFLISWHQHNLPSHESWLEPRERGTKKNARMKILIMIFAWPAAPLIYRNNPMVFFHTVLILANAAIVTGGSYLAGANLSDPNTTAADVEKRLLVAKISRTTGQSVFLACNALLVIAIIHTMIKDKRETKSRPNGRIHPTLWLLFISWFPLIVRGVFGVLQSAIWNLSYYNPENYTADGFTARFTAIEYCLGVLTEWTACVILNLTYLTSRKDPSKQTFRQDEEKSSIEDSPRATA